MSVLIGFLPWIVYWVFLGYHKLHEATLAGLAFSLIVLARSVIRRRGAKILDVGTAVFFLSMSVFFYFVDPYWLGHWVSVIGNASLAFIVFISIVIGKPFTMQYARESTPKEIWATPEFLRANLIISLAWFAVFLANVSFSIVRVFVPTIGGFYVWAFSMGCFFTGTAFTNWYRSHLNNQAQRR